VSSDLLIGAIVDSPLLDRWKIELLERIIATRGMKVAVIVVLKGVAEEAPFQLRGYRWLDRALFSTITRARDPLQREPIDPRLTRGNRVILHRSVASEPRGLDAETVRSLANARLDVVLDLCQSEAGAPTTAATCGVWRLEHGEHPTATPGEAYLREVWDGRTTIRATLRIRSREHPQGLPAVRAVWRTYPLSLYVNQVRAFERAGALLCDVLDRLSRGEQSALARPQAPCRDKPTDAAAGPSPFALAAKTCSRIARRIIYRLRHREEWVLHCRPCRSGRAPWEATFGGKPLAAPAGHFYADPFLCKNAGGTYLFFEDYRFDERKGVISYVMVDSAGNTSEPRVALERPYHLSYPFIFEHQNVFYMIPETMERQRVEVFRADSFPERWVPETVLLDDVAAVDATLFQHDRRYWLLLGRCHGDSSEAEDLCAFSSTSPMGEWQPHRLNPVIRDARYARPAGAAFSLDGALVIPVQDGALRYGHRIRFMRVDELTPSAWEWTEIGRLEPAAIPGSHAIHTYSRSDDFEVVDAQVLARRF
jgi:hypothetical protein